MRKLFIQEFDTNRNYAGIIDNPTQLSTPHTHDYFEFTLVRSGTCVHHINGQRQSLATACLNFIRPNDQHYYQPTSPNFSIVNIIIPAERIELLFAYLGNGFEPARLLDAPLAPLAQLSMTDFQALQNELEQLMLYKRLLGEKADAMFHITLINMLSRHFPMTFDHNRSILPVWLRWLTLEMLKQENFVEGLPAMIRLSGKSAEHLARSCRKHLGVSPTHFINQVRLHHAAELLLATDRPIIDICHETGFENLSNFYHVFRKLYGCAPKRYRLARDASPLPGDSGVLGILPPEIPKAPPMPG